MTSVSRNVYIDKLDDILNKCNNTYHGTIKMYPADVTSNTYFDFNKKYYRKDLKNDLHGEEIVGKFCKKTIKKSLNWKIN